LKDKRAGLVPVGCGKCMECKRQKSREWQVRLQEEIRHDNSGKFVTLSFSEESLISLQKEIKGLSGYELDNQVATLGTRRFLERWRKRYKKSVKHWLVTELGQKNTERIHIHGILFTNESKETIEEIWKYGNIWIGEYVNERTVNYIVKYINKVDPIHKEYKEKILTSPGIGKGYFNRIDWKNNQYKGDKTNELYRTRNGLKIPLPIYYRNKIYSEEEREKLWLQKLDKEVRYVDGLEIDISNGEEAYYKVLEEARLKNKFFGFGDDSINWERKRYERERRRLKNKERFAKMFSWGKKR
jgi:hypothetical protein